MLRSTKSAGLLVLLMLLAPPLSAQSAQMWSLQVSGLGSLPFGGGLDRVTPGPGWEAQLRVNPTMWSFGFGVEQTFHTVEGNSARSVDLLGGFFEPRRVIDIGSNSAAVYLAARFALSQVKVSEGGGSLTGNGFTINGGGGLLVRLGGRANLDLGMTIGHKKLGSVEYPSGPEDMGTGTNAIARMGLAFGLGG
jgi:hypothetical protein